MKADGISRSIGIAVLIAQEMGETNYSNASEITEDLLIHGITMHGVSTYEGIRVKLSYAESEMRQKLRHLGLGLLSGIPYQGYLNVTIEDMHYNYSTPQVEDLLREIKSYEGREFRVEVAAA